MDFHVSPSFHLLDFYIVNCILCVCVFSVIHILRFRTFACSKSSIGDYIRQWLRKHWDRK